MVKLSLEGVGAAYGARRILSDVSTPVFKGSEVIAVVGPNAAGKSTLFKRIAGLVDGPGEVRIEGSRRGMDGICYMPQDSVATARLIVYESVLLARKLGWTGAVLKSPKGLSGMLLIACVAAREKIFVCGGDMSCPGAALVQTANFQAHVPGITSIEANARQYLPQANRGWDDRFPGIFRVTDGWVRTSHLNGPGLGA